MPDRSRAAGAGTSSPARTTPALVTQPWAGKPSALAFGFGHLWVADDSANTVTRVDPTTGLTDGPAIVVGRGPTAVATGDGAVWVVCTPTSSLYRIDPSTQAVVGGPIPVATDPVAVVAGDGAVWVASLAGASLTRVDPTLNQADALVPYPAGPVRLALTSSTLWVTGSDGTLSRLDPHNGQALAATLALGGSSFGVATDARSAWVSDFLGNQVRRVSIATGSVVGSPIPVGHHPGVMADGSGSVWVTNHDDSSVSRINSTTGALAARSIAVGGVPRDVVVDPNGQAWVVTVRPSALVRLTPPRTR
ncbi:MAG: hypothetical protein ACRD0I_00420 [Acidimicrobiales bacterium]